MRKRKPTVKPTARFQRRRHAHDGDHAPSPISINHTVVGGYGVPSPHALTPCNRLLPVRSIDHRNKKKALARNGQRLLREKPGNDLLSRPAGRYHRRKRLNGRVRDGNGCIPLAMITGNIHSEQPCASKEPTRNATKTRRCQPLGGLVPVS